LLEDLENGLEKAHFCHFGTLKMTKNGLENLEKTLKMASKKYGNPGYVATLNCKIANPGVQISYLKS